jgi:putative tricarboxylic transport membrane protein
VTSLRRVAAPLLGLFLAGGLFTQAADLDAVAGPGQLGPGFWPRLTLVGLGLACLVKLVHAWRSRPARAGRDAPAPVLARGMLALAIAAVLGYVAVLPLLGFPLASAGFVVVFMALGGARSRAGIAATAVAGTVALLYVFVKLVYLPLPKGDGPFETLTVALYRALRIF